MKKILILLCLAIGIHCFYAQKYLTKNGTTQFEASVPLFEDIDATSTETVAILNIGNGGIAALVTMQSFQFGNSLMQEHFNENYVESSKYPKASFSGIVENLNANALDNKSTNYKIVGTLNLHGQDKKISSYATIFYQGKDIVINGSFEVKPEDFKIKIPKLVSNKIAETVTVNYSYTLKLQQ